MYILRRFNLLILESAQKCCYFFYSMCSKWYNTCIHWYWRHRGYKNTPTRGCFYTQGCTDLNNTRNVFSVFQYLSLSMIKSNKVVASNIKKNYEFWFWSTKNIKFCDVVNLCQPILRGLINIQCVFLRALSASISGIVSEFNPTHRTSCLHYLTCTAVSRFLRSLLSCF